MPAGCLIMRMFDNDKVRKLLIVGGGGNDV